MQSGTTLLYISNQRFGVLLGSQFDLSLTPIGTARILVNFGALHSSP